MGFGAMWDSVSSGNFRDGFNNLLVSDKLLDQQKLNQNQLQARVADDYQKGLVDEEQAGQLMRIVSQGSYEWVNHNAPKKDPLAIFSDGVKATTTGIFDSALGAPSKLIPWWVWALLIVGAGVYFWPIISLALKFRSKI